jgi:hypothetical protein
MGVGSDMLSTISNDRLFDREGREVELQRFDDYPFHQAVGSVATPVTSDSHFNDGYYFAWYRPGEHWFCGLRVHPNNNVMDGYAGVVRGGEQRSIRVSRALHPDYDHLEVGPLKVAILEPMQRQRITLADNESALSFAVEVTATAPPHTEHGHTQYRHGRLLNHLIRYTQLGRAFGSVTADGTSQEVADWHSCRDHSWGIRSTMGPYVPIGGIEGRDVDPRAIRIWIPFETDSHSGFFHTHEDAEGQPLDFEGRLDFADGTSKPLTAVRHAFRYHEGSQRLSHGSFTLIDGDGEEHAYDFAASADPAHPQGFGYTRGWSDGGQPGVYRGEYAEEVERFRTDDPARALGPDHVPEGRRLGGTEFTSTITGPEGTQGMAHIEHMIYGKYKPYGFQGEES